VEKRFLLIGAGGMGMAPLSLYLRQQNYNIYGYDDALPIFLEHFFERQNIIICESFPENIDRVIYSSAIPKNHPWLMEAKKRGIEISLRGEFLAQFCEKKKMIAIAGSHGKTTVVGMLIDCFPHCDYILGGFFQSEEKLPANYALENEFLICEVDESDHTIERFSPHVTVVLNLEDDHLVQYGSVEKLDLAFEMLFQNTRHTIIIPDWDTRLEKIIKNSNATAKVIKVKIAQWASALDKNLSILQCIFNLLENDALESHMPSKFSSLFRRNQSLGTLYFEQPVEILADYAHHPTEVSQCIVHFEEKKKEVAFVFQPHRYTRTQQYAQDFAKVFTEKNCTFLPVYPVGEKFLTDGTTETILNFFPENNRPKLITSLNDFTLEEGGSVLQVLNKSSFPNKIIFVGAGDIFYQAKEWVFKQQIQLVKIFLIAQGIAFSENISIKKYNTFCIGGSIPLLIEPESTESFATVLKKLIEIKIPFLIIGHGSNLLVDDLCHVLISQKKMPQIFTQKEDWIEVSANFSLPLFCRRITNLGFYGCEELAGIPGTIGGALYMNAGAHQQTISDKLISMEVIDFAGNFQVIHKSQISFTYREGFRSGVILGAKFQFTAKEASKILLEKIHQKTLWRQENQPQEPNIGSIFKNPQNCSAGALIDRADLKGTQIGGAQISPKHANFIVNATGYATANDVKRLINLIRQEVLEKYEIILKREILFTSEVFRSHF
jgi:UDP-N-acetylenolpyruvoylglucosamine reductase